MVHIDDTTRRHIRGLFWFALILAMIAGGAVLTACSSPKRVTGTVVEKDYDPPMRRSAADYDITVRDANGDEHEIDVSKTTYDKYKIGDKYPK